MKVVLGVGFAAFVAILQSHVRRPATLPVTLFLAIVVYNLVVAILGIPLDELRASGWVMPLYADGLWPPIVPADFAVIDWGAIGDHALMMPGIVIVTVMALLMNATGIELNTGRDLDLDRELRSVGPEPAAGAGGGVPGYPAVSLTLLSTRLGAEGRLVGPWSPPSPAASSFSARGSSTRPDAAPRHAPRLDRRRAHL